MGCRSCESENLKKFIGLKNIDQPIVFVFPELSVCLDCGTAEFVVPEAELSQLATGEDDKLTLGLIEANQGAQ
jgi:hypothetical protein